MYLFTYEKVVDNRVRIDRKFDTTRIDGLCLSNSIRFYNWDLLEYVNSREFRENGGSRELKRQFNSNMDDFPIEDSLLKLRERNSSDVTKTYSFRNGVFIMYTDSFFDIIESGKLTDYLKDNCFDPEDEKRILEKKPLVLTRTTNDKNQINFGFRS